MLNSVNAFRQLGPKQFLKLKIVQVKLQAFSKEEEEVHHIFHIRIKGQKLLEPDQLTIL